MLGLHNCLILSAAVMDRTGEVRIGFIGFISDESGGKSSKTDDSGDECGRCDHNLENHEIDRGSNQFVFRASQGNSHLLESKRFLEKTDASRSDDP